MGEGEEADGEGGWGRDFGMRERQEQEERQC